jgi:benzodiazapine receptor
MLMRLALSVLPILAASAAGSWITTRNIPDWHSNLTKPSFNPPNWVFGPVWTVLYIAMGYAIWRILALPEDTPGRRVAIGLFFAQLFLNASWSFAFFGANSPLLGLLVIVPLLALIAATLVSFWSLDRIAGLLFVPYLAWVGYATLLNTAIWWLNR